MKSLPTHVMTSRWLVISLLSAIANLPGLWATEGPVNPATSSTVLNILRDALVTEAAESGRWAYTETSWQDLGGDKPKVLNIVRFDPSKPYAEQYMPVVIAEKEPTEKQRNNYRQRGERRRQEVAPAASPAGPNPALTAEAYSALPAQVSSQAVTVNLNRAKVVAEDATSVTYELPITGSGKEEVAAGKFQVLIRVHRERRVLEQAVVKLTEAVWWGPARLRALEWHKDFTTINPRFAPQATSTSKIGKMGLLLIPANISTFTKRTDLHRVIPYNEGGGVKIGPVRLLEFLQ
jgi:hypothetical protein